MSPTPDEIDYRDQPDLPSHMTLRELSVVYMFATKYAIEAEHAAIERRDDVFDRDEIEISIMVRDRGQQGEAMTAPWIEFSVGKRRFVIRRSSLDLYELNPDGSVPDEPLHYGRA